MDTIKEAISYTYEINKSQFICHLKPVSTVNEAKEYIKLIKNKYQDATHNISIYQVGKLGQYGHYSDDGEPSGTAGKPAFDVLRFNHLTNIVGVITRYYGGIKLGAGGLVRAYSTAISETLKLATIVEIIEYVQIQLDFSYKYLDLILNILKPYQIIDKQYTDKIILKVKVDQKESQQLIDLINETFNNQIIIKITCEEQTNE